VPVTLLDAEDTVSDGSRAICWSKRTLDLDRLGCGTRSERRDLEGRAYHRGARSSFDLLPETGTRCPLSSTSAYYAGNT
jgi:3-(3-hydroxy-phenyl)propionate hydroxylase